MNDREVIDDEIDGLSLSEVNIDIATAASPNPRLTLLTMQVIQRARKTWHDWRGGMDADDELFGRRRTKSIETCCEVDNEDEENAHLRSVWWCRRWRLVVSLLRKLYSGITWECWTDEDETDPSGWLTRWWSWRFPSAVRVIRVTKSLYFGNKQRRNTSETMSEKNLAKKYTTTTTAAVTTTTASTTTVNFAHSWIWTECHTEDSMATKKTRNETGQNIIFD